MCKSDEDDVITCKVVLKECEHELGWWMLAALPRVDDALELGSCDLPEIYRVKFVHHHAVQRGEVTEHRPPYVELLVEPYASSGGSLDARSAAKS